MLLTRRQPDKPTAAANKLCSIRTLNGVYTEFGIDPSEGRDVDLRDELGLYIANENSNHMPKNSSQSLSEHRYTITIYQCNTPEYPLSADFSPSRPTMYASEMSLLERLNVSVGGMYLSGLRLSSNLILIQHVLRKIDPCKYSLQEWNDVVCYITGQRMHFHSREDAIHYLMTYSRTDNFKERL